MRYGQPELYVGLITNVLAFWAKPPKFEGFMEAKANAEKTNGGATTNNSDLELGTVQNGTEIDMESK
ncbi:hypothetical protein D6_00075 [Faustovirus]|nr:hypothetical protein D6_00075 [Faustovirus]